MSRRPADVPAAGALPAVRVLLVAGALLAHLVLIAGFVDAGRLLEPLPFAYGDYSIHYMDGLQVRDFLRTRHSFWGYSPWFFAGYPAGLFDAPSNRPTGLVLLLAEPLAAAVAFKLWVAAVLVAVPLLAGLAGALGGTPGKGLVATVAAIAYFHQDRVIYTFARYGMFHFLLACSLAMVAAVLFARLSSEPSVGRSLIAGAVLGLGLFVHPIAPFLAGPPIAWEAFRARRPAARIAIAAALGLAALSMLPWAPALVRHAAWLGPDSGFWSTGEVSLADDFVINSSLIARNLLLLLAAAGWALGERRHTGLCLAAAFCLLVRHTGSAWPVLERLEPARFTIPAGFFALLPAIDGARRLAGRPRLMLAVGLVGIGLVVPPLLLDPDFEAVPNFRLWTMPVDERPEAAALVEALDRWTDDRGRVWIEQDWAGSRLHGFVASVVRVSIRREQLGGPHPFVKTRENVLNFFDGGLAGRAFSDWPDGELAELLDRYNVGWLVLRRPSTIRAAAGRSFLEPVVERDGFLLCRVSGRRSWFLRGEGSVSADLDRIAVRDASPGGVILKYHYHPRLRTVPPLGIAAEPVSGDPDGFLRIDNGQTTDFDVILP